MKQTHGAMSSSMRESAQDKNIQSPSQMISLMQKSQSLATLIQFNNEKSGKIPQPEANNNFAARSSSKTTEQMVRSIQIDLEADAIINPDGQLEEYKQMEVAAADV